MYELKLSIDELMQGWDDYDKNPWNSFKQIAMISDEYVQNLNINKTDIHPKCWLKSVRTDEYPLGGVSLQNVEHWWTILVLVDVDCYTTTALYVDWSTLSPKSFMSKM